MDNAFLEDMSEDVTKQDDCIATKGTPVYHSEIARRIEDWIGNEGYRQPGITLNELSVQLCTNRTYLSEDINSV